MKNMIKIDGSMGEGGGQVLRSALALSMLTGAKFQITNIRAGRNKPGLLRQHLTAVKAAAEISNAEVHGAAIGSAELTFIPGKVTPGEYAFSVGTAGSATLVLQTVLPALITARGESSLVLEGGMHNPYAPPFDFLEKAFLPCLRKMGAAVACALHRPGYYPAGGGKFSVAIGASAQLLPIEINKRGESVKRCAKAIISQLSERIAKRELDHARSILNWSPNDMETIQLHNSNGPGNVLVLETHFEHITEIFTGFGERGLTAEGVAKKAAAEVREYLTSGAPVGRYLADQLLLPMSIAGHGSFITVAPTKHTLTNIDVVKQFLAIDISCRKITDNQWQITVG